MAYEKEIKYLIEYLTAQHWMRFYQELSDADSY